MGFYQGDGNTCEDINECDAKTHDCDVNALCTNVPGSYECECQGEYTGDGTKGNCAVCPSDECWNWDAVNKKCTLKENTGNNARTSITCDYNSMAFGWNSALFGLNKGDFASFVDPNVDPEYNATEDAYSWSMDLRERELPTMSSMETSSSNISWPSLDQTVLDLTFLLMVAKLTSELKLFSPHHSESVLNLSVNTQLLSLYLLKTTV